PLAFCESSVQATRRSGASLLALAIQTHCRTLVLDVAVVVAAWKRCLCSDTRPPMIATMDRTWYRRLLSRSQKPVREATSLDANYEDADVQFGMGLKFANSEGTPPDYAQAA